ncbi:hypothetical protein [Singulisphaera sp. GP187]|uniref:hypothetical protein n=1 Tax=Singulisphaera sp. GP187 TaxID=1882752 RepID=UPI0020B12730|nr:hypothetical protein [Singulisphaera sp. GP187]
MPPQGEVRLASGRVVEYTIHYDRNSLRASVRLGNDLIALTNSGTLLRFELPTVRLVRERIDVEEVTCLGHGEGEEILAGLGDGRICRVDVATLELKDVTKLPAAPRWMGWGQANGNRPAGLVVVTEPTKPVKGGGGRELPYSMVHDLATKQTFALEEVFTTFLLDRAGRVWLGADRGEWGGRLARVDLVNGTIKAIKPPPARDPDSEASWDGVYGFIELCDGQVWSFGGSSHMGYNSGYITRVDGAKPQPLYAFEPPRNPEGEPDPGRPSLPITHIIEEDNGLLVFSYDDVFGVKQTLNSWRRFATLELQYHWGRPDAVGSYPSVITVHPPSQVGEPYLLATVADGYVRLELTKSTSLSLPGQLGATDVCAVEHPAEGTLVFEGDDRLPPWTLGPKGWEIASLAPPFEIDPAGAAAEIEKGTESWYETRILVGPDGAISTVSGTGVSDGTRTTARRVGGKSLQLGRETSSLVPSASFLTADGTLWNAGSDGLKRFEQGSWKTVAPLLGDESPSGLNPLNTNGPPWLLLDSFGKSLWQLKPGVPGDKPQLTRIMIREGEKRLSTRAAIAGPSAALLLATDAGLRTYDPMTQRLSKVDFVEPPQSVNTLIRDGLGRLWLGGKYGVAMVEAGGKTLETFDRVPGIGGREVYALAPDPHHEDGVIVALGSRGAAFIRALPKP